MISELNDDVLLHILCFLPSATDVARAAVLSQRWRRLWALAPALHFAVGPGSFADEQGKDREKFAVSRRDAARRLIAGVDATLARRAASGEGDDDVDALAISLVYSSDVNRRLFKRKDVGERGTTSTTTTMRPTSRRCASAGGSASPSAT
jgi:hypothetical protein